MENLKNTFEKMDIKKVEKDKEFKKLYDAVKELLENNIYADCYIFEYVILTHRISTGSEDNGMIAEEKDIVNYIDSAKLKKIVKFNLEDYNPKATKEEKMNYIMDQANYGGTLKFYFNTPTNKKNPNKHLYGIVDVGGCEDSFHFTNTEDSDETITIVAYNDIIPISLKPFKM
tara:strand:+ start:3993 stop:4511 length:519 start_codon:yes stop_codon:yes gene_type:complete